MELIGAVVEIGTVEIYFIWAVLITTVGVLLFLISMAMLLHVLKLVRRFVALNQHAKDLHGIQKMPLLELVV